MPREPARKRAIAFVDGQNLYYAAKEAFGYTYPNYDPERLALKVCEQRGWDLVRTRFYTGIPDVRHNAFWGRFWAAKLAALGTRGVHAYARRLRYRSKLVKLPDGRTTTAMVGQEKGIDIRIALDVCRLTRENDCDVALIFSQDQDLTEVVGEVKRTQRRQNRWIKLACAFPVSPTSRNLRGVNGTDWIRIDRALYDACIDPNDYRPKKT